MTKAASEIRGWAHVQFGPYELDVRARQLYRAGRPLHLEPKVMDLLLYLSRRADQCVTKQELRAELWPKLSVSEASIHRLVKELRRALGGPTERSVSIRTIHGRGYQFVAWAEGRDTFGASAGAAQAAPVRWECTTSGVFPAQPAPALILGPRLAQIVAPLQRAACYGLPIVLEGETGTGKTCCAQALHIWSGRTGVAVHLRCSAATPDEFEALLAEATDPSSSVLLDDVGELSESLQRRLLSALSHENLSDPACLARRTIATSQHALAGLVERGQFRRDLFARLAGLSVELPALRQRREDLPGLARHFVVRGRVDRDAELPTSLMQRLLAHDWPFNVRELELYLLRWLALSGGTEAAASATEPLASGARAGFQPGERAALGAT